MQILNAYAQSIEKHKLGGKCFDLAEPGVMTNGHTEFENQNGPNSYSSIENL